MFYKRIVYVWICFLLTIVIGTISVSILVDPINIWGTPIINGFNNYKVKTLPMELLGKVFLQEIY